MLITRLCRQGEDAAPTRVIVFASSPEAAQAAAQPIRNVLWGQHNVTVLLPQGEEPIKVSTRTMACLHSLGTVKHVVVSECLAQLTHMLEGLAAQLAVTL